MKTPNARFVVCAFLTLITAGIVVRYAEGFSPSTASADTGSSRVGRYVALMSYSLSGETELTEDEEEQSHRSSRRSKSPESLGKIGTFRSTESLEDGMIYVTVMDTETGLIVRRERCAAAVYNPISESTENDFVPPADVVGAKPGKFVASIYPLEATNDSQRNGPIYVTVLDSETGQIVSRTRYSRLAYTAVYE